jgi:hypothetical protein
MKSGFRVTGILFLSFSAFAQQTVTIPLPGAAKPIQGDLYGGGTRVFDSLPAVFRIQLNPVVVIRSFGPQGEIDLAFKISCPSLNA